jgi:quercetin dioxygenase-like cupin family protein
MRFGSQKDVKAEVAPMPGAKGASIQWLIARPEGAGNFYMRRIIIEENGLIPEHQHPEEHEIYILTGQGEIRSNGQSRMVGPGDFVFIPGGEMHSSANVGRGQLTFICCINKVEQAE